MSATNSSLATAHHFGTTRDCPTLQRRVRNDCAVEVDGNAYSVPRRLIGERVEVTVAAGQVRVRHGVRELAVVCAPR